MPPVRFGDLKTGEGLCKPFVAQFSSFLKSLLIYLYSCKIWKSMLGNTPRYPLFFGKTMGVYSNKIPLISCPVAFLHATVAVDATSEEVGSRTPLLRTPASKLIEF